MKTMIGTSFGLALLLALGVIGAMLALGTFSAPKAEADVDTTAISASPTRAGSASQISISFRHQTVQTAGTGQIRVLFSSAYGFPAASGTLPKASITLTTGQTTGGTSIPAVDPTYTSNAAGDKTVVITIDDTSSATDRQDMFPNASPGGVATAAGVHTLVFGTPAGITLPTAAGTASATVNFVVLTVGPEVGGEVVAAGLGFDGVAAPFGITTFRTLELSSTTGGAASVVTVTGYGFTSGLSPRVYIDGTVGLAGSGTFTADDTDLQVESTPAIAGGTFTRTFTVDTVRFAAAGAYNISADDGVGNVSSAAPDNTPTWTLRGTATVDKTSARRGETVQVRLRQFGAGAVQIVSFGGVQATIPAGTTVPASGTLNIDIAVPTTTPLGTQRISVTAAGEAAARTVNIDVVGAPLTLSPSTAAPEQDITVSGSGFTGGSVINTLGQITIGAAAVPLANIASGAAVTADNSGNIVATVRIPVNATTRTAGSYTLTVADATGRTGNATLTIPSRTVATSPASGGRNSSLTVSGTGFPTRRTVNITYTDTAVRALGSATPDSTGAFTGTFTVPTTAGIPSTNTITVTAAATALEGGDIVATGTHSVSGAAITVAPASGSPGTTITVSGTGFPGFASMTVLNIGGIAAIPTPAPSSDTNGAFTTTALVPQVNVGTQAVSVTVGGIVGTSSLSVVAAPPAPVVPVVVAPTATATVFADVVAQAENLVRVWRYSNATQSWAFYDPRPAFAAANTLTTTSSKDIVWVNIKVQQTFQGQTLFPGWNLISLN